MSRGSVEQRPFRKGRPCSKRVLETFRHGQTGMDQSGNSQRLAASDRGTMATVGDMAIANRRCSVSGSQSNGSLMPITTLSSRSISQGRRRQCERSHGLRHEGFRRQRTCGQVGESTGSHGVDRWFRGRHYPGTPPVETQIRECEQFLVRAALLTTCWCHPPEVLVGSTWRPLLQLVLTSQSGATSIEGSGQGFTQMTSFSEFRASNGSPSLLRQWRTPSSGVQCGQGWDH